MTGVGGKWVRRAWWWAAVKVRDLRGWLDREVVGEYDTYGRRPTGALFRLQVWMMGKAKKTRGEQRRRA